MSVWGLQKEGKFNVTTSLHHTHKNSKNVIMCDVMCIQAFCRPIQPTSGYFWSNKAFMIIMQATGRLSTLVVG